MFGVLLNLAPQGQNRQVVQFQLGGQFVRRFAFQNATQQQDDLWRCKVMLLQDGPGVEVINMLALLTTIHLQLACASHAKPIGLCDRLLTPWTLQPLRVKVFLDPFFAFFGTQ